MSRRWMSTAAAAALGLALALGGITPALAEEAGAADEGSGEVAAQAGIQTIETVMGEARPIHIGETVKGSLHVYGPSKFAIVNDNLDPNVDGMVDVTLRVTDWGSDEDGVIKFDISLPPFYAMGTLGYRECVRGERSECSRLALRLDPALIASANEEIGRGEVDHVYIDQKSPAAYVLHVYGMGDCSFELSVTPSDVPAYHEDRYRTSNGNVLAREWGSDAFGTMTAIMGSWGDPDTVILATSEGYWDALAASSLAGIETRSTWRYPVGNLPGCPLLITGRKKLTAQTRALIQSFDPKRVVIVGGRAAVSDEVAGEVKSLGVEVERVWGKDAVDTAIKIYEDGLSVERMQYVGNDPETGDAQFENVAGWGDTAIVATSTGYWDALSVAPYSYSARAPIFLTGAGNRLTDDALHAIAEGGFSRAIIVGGGAVVSRDVEAQLDGVGVAHERLAGNNAIETSAKIVAWSAKEGFGADGVYVATTDGYWDALCGAACAGSSDYALALVDAAGTHMEAVESAIAQIEGDSLQSSPMHVAAHVLGGKAAVSDNALQQILNML